MASQLVALRRANERLLLSAMIPPPNAPGLMSRVSTARQGTTAMKLVFDEIAALGPIRKGSAEGTDQFLSGIGSSLVRLDSVESCAIPADAKSRMAMNRLVLMESPCC